MNDSKKRRAPASDANHMADKIGGTNNLSSYCNDTTGGLGLKTPAEYEFSKIGVGREHAHAVNNNDGCDRVARGVRALVQDARRNGVPIVNTGNGKGYCICRMDRPDEIDELRHTIAWLRRRGYQALETAAALAEATGEPGARP